MAGFNTQILVAIGAYGREANIADWQAGKDFKIMDGPYFSIRDLAEIKGYGTQQICFLNPKGFSEFVVEV